MSVVKFGHSVVQSGMEQTIRSIIGGPFDGSL